MNYKFDTFTVDTSKLELKNGDDAVHIEPKPLDLLIYFLERCDRVVSKNEIVENVWSGLHISDATISSAVRSIRKAIGDDNRDRGFVKTIHGRGFRFVGGVTSSETKITTTIADGVPLNFKQEIGFCSSDDGTNIAYAIAGQGPHLVKAANWLTHLEFDWESPLWNHFFTELASRNRFIRYDARGNGLSDWNVTEFGLERQVEDLKSVVDKIGLDKFPLIGISQGCAKAVVFAARYPKRVSKLILIGGYARGWNRRDDTDVAIMRSSAVDLIKAGWGKDNPAVHQMFTSLYMPDAPPEAQKWFSDLQRKTATAANAAKILVAHGDVDIRALLPEVKAATLVIHANGDAGVPFEEGKLLASGIAKSHFVALDTSNHLLPSNDRAWIRCAKVMREFLSD